MHRAIRWLALALLIVTASSVVAQKLPEADQVLAQAEATAAAQNKHILLVFGASWCKYCHQFDKFAASPEIRPIFEKNFVTAELSVDEEAGDKPYLNNPGGEQMMAKLGGDVNGGVPFIVFMDAKGQMIVNSLRPVVGQANGENVGYPATPEEIDWFMKMLRKSAVSLTDGEAQTVESWLSARGQKR